LLFHETELPGAFIIEPQPVEDSRGFFARVFCQNEFANHKLNPTVAQCNVSWNVRKKTLRGMHFQVEPHAEVKLVRCTRGAVYDVIIDLRHDSATFGQWTARELTAANHLMMYVPEGFAHGYQALEDGTEVFYQVSASYALGFERGIRWNDPAFNVQWPYTDPILSEKDKSQEDWKG
jgi:dTDP-4-dehydrorhamnose 3,5-epimerase